MPAVAAVTIGCDVRHNARTESLFAERCEVMASLLSSGTARRTTPTHIISKEARF